MKANQACIKLDDPRLFGNESAEDEEEAIFQAYALSRSELEEFSSEANHLLVARAYKGEGKSALLRLTRMELARAHARSLVISTTGNALAPRIPGASHADLVRTWKRAILDRVAREVGARINHAWSGDASALVDEAERSGFRERNLIKSLFSGFTLQCKLSAASISGSTSIRPEDFQQKDAEALLKRLAEDYEPIWIFLDDIDQNFQNTPENRSLVGSCFVACRELMNTIPQLRFRAAVRPNVWTILKLEHEALSHLDQYMRDLTWSEESMCHLLAKRIEGYLTLTNQWSQVQSTLKGTEGDRHRALNALVFERSMEWGKTTRPPHVLLYTLSKHRPRWMVELCKVAAREAALAGRSIVVKPDIVANLAAFGGRRIEDTVAEFKSQCPEVQELIAAFRKGKEQMNTSELFETIDRKILQHVSPRIVGVLGKASSRDVAAFLFQMGFIFGRSDSPDGSYTHISFSERPHLFTARSSIDDGLSWEIHPVFRQALEVRDSTGKEVSRKRQPRR